MKQFLNILLVFATSSNFIFCEEAVSEYASLSPKAAEKISGDVGLEQQLVTENPFLVTFPTINWEDLLKNIPTLPPLVLPTIDPNFWSNLPTIPPLVLPTIDPNFWSNLPTIPPLVLPTLDPNFWQNLPTLPPLPTLDPNFWNNFPTIPPLTFPTLPPFVFPTPTPKTSQCTYKLADKIRKDSNFTSSLDFTSTQNLVDSLQNEAVLICSTDQVDKLNALVQKYSSLIVDMQKVVPLFSEDEMKSLTLAILNGDSSEVFRLFFTKSLSNIGNQEIPKVSSQISMLQFDLLLNPI